MTTKENRDIIQAAALYGVVNEMEMTDIRFKNDLRKELITLEHFLELLDSDKKDDLRKAIEKEIKRVNETLQD